jgi:hypothetical protein
MKNITAKLICFRENPGNVRYRDLCKVCDFYFGDPRVNIQNHKGMAKAYQVRQVLNAIEKLIGESDVEG